MRIHDKKIKKLLLPSVMLLLTACNGTEESTHTSSSGDQAPQANGSESNGENTQTKILNSMFEKFELVSVTDSLDLIYLSEIQDGDVINVNDVPTPNLNIVATPLETPTVESVRFVVDGPVQLDRIENTPVYTVADQYQNLSLDGESSIEGEYSVTATTFELDNAQGNAGTPTTITFTLINTAVPLISDISLVSTSSNFSITPIETLADGAEIDINSLTSELLNITAETEGAVGSIRFSLNGPITINRVENNPPYTMANSNENISLDSLALGDYSLTVIPYSGPDGTGEVGITKEINFSVVNRDQPNPTNVPLIQSVQWVAINDGNGSLTTVEAIANNQVYNMALNPTANFNFTAVSEDENQTGSVHFNLTGPTPIERTENQPPYTMQDQNLNFSVSEQGMAPGKYELTVTPYAEPNRGGEMGVSYKLSFEVKNEVDSTALVARPDSIEVKENTAYQSSDNNGLGSNDVYNSSEASFTLLNQAQNGYATVSNNGSFTT